MYALFAINSLTLFPYAHNCFVVCRLSLSLCKDYVGNDEQRRRCLGCLSVTDVRTARRFRPEFDVEIGQSESAIEKQRIHSSCSSGIHPPSTSQNKTKPLAIDRMSKLRTFLWIILNASDKRGYKPNESYFANTPIALTLQTHNQHTTTFCHN